MVSPNRMIKKPYSRSHPFFDANIIKALLKGWNNSPSHLVLSQDKTQFVSANKCCKDETHLFHGKPREVSTYQKRTQRKYYWINNRKNPQRLLDDYIQVRHILSLCKGDRITFGGKGRVKLGMQMYQSCATVKQQQCNTSAQATV